MLGFRRLESQTKVSSNIWYRRTSFGSRRRRGAQWSFSSRGPAVQMSSTSFCHGLEIWKKASQQPPPLVHPSVASVGEPKPRGVAATTLFGASGPRASVGWADAGQTTLSGWTSSKSVGWFRKGCRQRSSFGGSELACRSRCRGDRRGRAGGGRWSIFRPHPSTTSTSDATDGHVGPETGSKVSNRSHHCRPGQRVRTIIKRCERLRGSRCLSENHGGHPSYGSSDYGQCCIRLGFADGSSGKRADEGICGTSHAHRRTSSPGTSLSLHGGLLATQLRGRRRTGNGIDGEGSYDVGASCDRPRKDPIRMVVGRNARSESADDCLEQKESWTSSLRQNWLVPRGVAGEYSLSQRSRLSRKSSQRQQNHQGRGAARREHKQNQMEKRKKKGQKEEPGGVINSVDLPWGLSMAGMRAIGFASPGSFCSAECSQGLNVPHSFDHAQFDTCEVPSVFGPHSDMHPSCNSIPTFEPRDKPISFLKLMKTILQHAMTAHIGLNQFIRLSVQPISFPQRAQCFKRHWFVALSRTPLALDGLITIVSQETAA